MGVSTENLTSNIAQFTDRRNNDSQTQGTNNDGNSRKFRNRPHRSNVRFEEAKIESNPATNIAYSAQEPSVSSTASTSGPPSKRVVKIPSKPCIDKLVSRTHNVWIQLSGGSTVPYVASRPPCHLCFPSNGNPTRAHVPSCSNVVCSTCDLVGHIPTQCLQTELGYKHRHQKGRNKPFTKR